MTEKTPIGLPPIDQALGGVYRARSFLLCGAKGSGKTRLALGFLGEGLRRGQKGLLLSAHGPEDVSALGPSLGVDFASALRGERLHVLPGSELAPDFGEDGSPASPEEGAAALLAFLEDRAVDRLALDPVLPWVQIEDPDAAAQGIHFLVRSLDRTGLTTMATLPLPASAMAEHIRELVEINVPCAFEIRPAITPSGEEHPLVREVFVRKYLGMPPASQPFRFTLNEGPARP